LPFWIDKLLILLAAATALLALVLVIGVIAKRISQLGRERKLRESCDRLRPMLTKYLVGEVPPEEMLSQFKSSPAAAEHLLLHFLQILDGEERKLLLDLARDLGIARSATRALRSLDWTVRETAAMRLGILRLPESVPALAPMLLDHRMPVRYTAARSLAMIGSSDAFLALVELLAKPDVVDTPRLLEIVHQTLRTDVEPLRRIVEDENTPLASRLLLIDVIGDWREYRLVDALRGLLSSDETEIVLRAIKALVRIGDMEILPLILQRIDDPSWQVRAIVARAVGSLEFAEAAPLLERLLTDPAFWVRRNVANSLLRLGPVGLAVLRRAGDLGDSFALDQARYSLERLNGLEIPKEAFANGGEALLEAMKRPARHVVSAELM